MLRETQRLAAELEELMKKAQDLPRRCDMVCAAAPVSKLRVTLAY
jgi:hypothetical protein